MKRILLLLLIAFICPLSSRGQDKELARMDETLGNRYSIVNSVLSSGFGALSGAHVSGDVYVGPLMFNMAVGYVPWDKMFVYAPALGFSFTDAGESGLFATAQASTKLLGSNYSEDWRTAINLGWSSGIKNSMVYSLSMGIGLLNFRSVGFNAELKIGYSLGRLDR